MSNLYRQSIELIQQYQDPGGGYLACPNFPTYQYSWLRDGSFCAYAMDLCEQSHSASRFHQWVLRVLRSNREKMTACIRQATSGVRPLDRDCLHSRFTAAGEEVPGNWGHHQLDGLGTWLWAYGAHLTLTGERVASEDVDLLHLAHDYLAALWPFPCSDCWEENETKISTHSLAAVYAGLTALSDMLADSSIRKSAESVRTYLLDNLVIDGHFVKNNQSAGAVDANLLFLAVPYQVLPLDDPRIRTTLERIQADLTGPEGGVHRYSADTYYGGGEWIILSACLGWVAAQSGNEPLALRQLQWVEAQASPDGFLPEQVPANLNAPDYLPVWTERWGSSATPLLWSHAQYIILHQAINPGFNKETR